jgi:OOP family OmpA-OmpF porin
MKSSVAIISAALLCAALASAQDAEGCKDSPLVERYPGTVISSCEHKEFDSAKMLFGNYDNATEKDIEGEVYIYEFVYKPDASELQIYRNLFNALRKAGYQPDYEESPYKFTVHSGTQYIGASIGGGAYTLTTVKQKEMEQKVQATAAEMQSELDKSGHVAVYGIEFATGKAEILPASDTVLQQVLQLLNQQPNLKVRIEGHTDNTGNRAANQALSERRAQAVSAWLVSHGVSGDRLSAQGFADSRPVADNSTEEGRAKNRRVELVKVS